MSAADHMARVAELPCAICITLGQSVYGVHVHHIKEGTGLSQRSSNWLVLPLCPEHHMGAGGIHGLGTKAFKRIYGVSELELLAWTLQELYDQ